MNIYGGTIMQLTNKKTIKIYISGSMSGIENYNYSAFNKAELELQALGLVVINPATIKVEDWKQWSDYMREALRMMLDANAIYLLKGWEESKGANIEKELAEKLGMKVMYEVNVLKQKRLLDVSESLPKDIIEHLYIKENENGDVNYCVIGFLAHNAGIPNDTLKVFESKGIAYLNELCSALYDYYGLNESHLKGLQHENDISSPNLRRESLQKMLKSYACELQ